MDDHLLSSSPCLITSLACADVVIHINNRPSSYQVRKISAADITASATNISAASPALMPNLCFIIESPESYQRT